jgi:amidase
MSNITSNTTSNILFLAAHQLAQIIRDRQIPAIELLEAYLTQINKYNPKLHAICTLDVENARVRAKLADEALAKGENWGVLHGVPITIKDTFETVGIASTAGYKPLKNYIPKQDATAVSRLRNAGAIILGKTNPSDLAGDYQGINQLFPTVNNPWNLNYTPGGSSSGSAAAIASGLSALDLCSDFGGSIRLPAHFCGIYGLKTTDRRVPTTGHIPEIPGVAKSIRQMLTVGTLARSIEDLRLSLKIIAGADSRQPDIPPVPLDEPNYKALENLRIVWIDEISNFPVAGEIKTAMQSVFKKLDNENIHIAKWVSKFDFVAAWKTYYAVATYNLMHANPTNWDYVRKSLAFIFREVTQGDKALRKLSQVPQIAFSISFNPSLKNYFEALTQRDDFIAQMDKELEPYDALVCPVAMTTAFTHRPKGAAVEIDGRKVPYMMACGAYLVPFNLTGNPVVVIPIGKTQSGLPIGMQIIGKRWKEMELLSIAEAIDKVINAFEQIPVNNL